MTSPISNTPYARALYDYNAAGNINKNGHTDASFRKGEFVEILTQKPFGGWMLAKVESTGNIGWLPMNYFRMNVYKEKNYDVPVIVLHDSVSSGYLLSNRDKDLSVKKGEIIYQIDPNINNGWIRVRNNNNGEVGVIPASYVAKLSSFGTTPIVPQHRTDKNNNNNNGNLPSSQQHCELEQLISCSTSSDAQPPPISNDSAPPSQAANIATLRMCSYSAPAVLNITIHNQPSVPSFPPKTPPSNPNKHELPHQPPYNSNTLPPSRPPLAKAASQMYISELTKELSLLLQERRRKSETETAIFPVSPDISSHIPYPRVATPIPSKKPAPPTTPKPAYLIEEILSEVRPRRHSSTSSDDGTGNMTLPGLVSDELVSPRSPRSPRSSRPVPVSVPTSCIKCGKAGHWADSCLEGEEEKQEEGITFTYHKGKMMIKAATKERLLEGLYSEKIATYDFISEYVDVFLLTYRTFVTPKELFQAISAVYQEACTGSDEERLCRKPKRVRVCNFLKKWMENFSNDFESDPELMQMYEMFVTENMSQDESLMSVLTKAIRRRGFKPEKISVVLQSPKPMIPKTVSFFDIEPLELARQMCLMDYEMFKSIGARELLAKHWVGSVLVHTSPNLWKMIQRFNQVSNWVAHCVVREESAKKRAAVIQRFLKVGKECLALNNFNAVFQITSGLHSSAVHRLKKSWEVVNKEKEYGIFEELKTMTATRNSFVVYRERLRSANPPCIPFFGVYQSDLTFIADGNPDIFDNGYVNFFKRRLVAEVIKEMQTFQQTSYILNEVEVIQTWLKSQDMENLDAKTIYGISLSLEPREGTSDHITEKVKAKAKSFHKDKKRRDSFSIPSLDGLKSIMYKSQTSTSNDRDSGKEESPGRKPRSKLNKFFGEQNINFDFYVKYSQASSLDEPVMEDSNQPVERPEYSKITAPIDMTPAQIEQFKKEQIAKYNSQHRIIEKQESKNL